MANEIVFERLEIKKSQFLSVAVKVESIEEFDQIWEKIKIENKKATHICFAARIKNDVTIEKFFDDGEPNGTAGRPILGVIKKNGLENLAVFVVRHFGGIKLGAGGLLRAYVKSSALAISAFQKK